MAEKTGIEIEISANSAQAEAALAKTEKSVDEVAQATRDYTDAANRLNNANDQLPPPLDRAISSFSTLNQQLNYLIENLQFVTNAISAPIDAFAEYDAAVRASANLTGADLGQIKALTNETALAYGRFGGDVSKAIGVVGSASPALLENVSALQAVTNQSLLLADAAKATGDAMSDADAAGAITAGLNQWGISASDATVKSAEFANVLAASAQLGSASITQVIESLKNAGTTMAMTNISFEEFNALTQTLAERQIKGSEAGIALRNVVSLLMKEGEKFESFGISAQSVNPKIQGIETALRNLKPILDDDVAMLEIFGMENVNAAKVLATSTDKINQLTQGLTGTDTAIKQAEAGAAAYNAQIAAMGGLLQTLAAVTIDNLFGTTLAPSIGAINDGLTFVIQNLDTIGAVAQVVFNTILVGAAVRYAPIGLAVATSIWGQVAALNAGAIAARAMGTAMAFAGGPVGLALMAVAAGGTIAYQAWTASTEDTNEALAKNATASTQAAQAAQANATKIAQVEAELAGKVKEHANLIKEGKINAAKEAQKEIEAALKESEKAEQNYVDRVAELQNKLRDNAMSSQDKIRELRQKSMSEEGADADKVLLVFEKFNAAKAAAAAGNSELAEKLYDDAISKSADLEGMMNSFQTLSQSTDKANQQLAQTLKTKLQEEAGIDIEKLKTDGDATIQIYEQITNSKNQFLAQEIAATQTAAHKEREKQEDYKAVVENLQKEIAELTAKDNEISIKIKTDEAEAAIAKLKAEIASLQSQSTGASFPPSQPVQKFATGGVVGGFGNGDTVPAMLTPQEFVVRAPVATRFPAELAYLNATGKFPAYVPHLAAGGFVGGNSGGNAGNSPSITGYTQVTVNIGGQSHTLLGQKNQVDGFVQSLAGLK